MSLRDYPDDRFANQDIIKHLTTSECRELSNLKEMKRSTTAVLLYLEEREGVIFSTVRARVPEGGENHVD